MVSVDTHQNERGRPPKVGHRKSRNGCMKCKSRRVKCDERRPVCGNCHRLQMDCAWPDAAPSTRSRPTPSPNSSAHLSPPSTGSAASASTGAHHSPISDAVSSTSAYMTNWPRWPSEDNPFAQVDDSQGISLPESRARRVMEHRLMQNWYQNFNNPFPINPAQSWRSIWCETIPALALRHDNVLYGLLATSATNMMLKSREGDGDGTKDLFAARQSYFISALHQQRQEVAKLSVENAEPVCFGALLISICTFAMLKRRVLDPYSPPMEWLQLGRGAGTVIWQSVETIITQSREADYPALMTIARSYPYFGKDQSYFSPEMRRNLEGVLTRHLPSGDDWADDDTREAYEKTLSYVGSIQKGIDDGEPVYALTRRIQTFALLAPPRFIGLLSMQRPRALVIMAHFWATVAQVHNVWWLGDAGLVDDESTAKREIRAIKKVLPKEWMATMVWPLDQVGLRDLEWQGLT